METHSSILAWRIPWTEEPGGLQPTESQRDRHNWVTRYTSGKKTKKSVLYLLQMWTYDLDTQPQGTRKLEDLNGKFSHLVKDLFFFFFFQFSSVAQSCPTLCDPKNCSTQASLFITNSWSLLKPITIVLMMPSNHLILGHPLLILLSIFPSIRIFSNESVLRIKWPKYWGFSFRINPSNEYSGLVSFRIDWLDLLAVQGTLESSPNHC